MSAVTPRRTPIMAPKTDADRPGHHLRPVLTVLAFLIPMVWLTVYYYDQSQPAPFVPSNILVLALLNVDIILLVVLVLLLSRNLVKAYFERRQKLLGSGFRRSEEHTSELQSPCNLVCRLLLEKKKQRKRDSEDMMY